jgi:hypothetical protein
MKESVFVSEVQSLDEAIEVLKNDKDKDKKMFGFVIKNVPFLLTKLEHGQIQVETSFVIGNKENESRPNH